MAQRKTNKQAKLWEDEKKIQRIVLLKKNIK